jgi:hypothetical protein
MTTSVEFFITVFGIYLVASFIVPSIMLHFDVFPVFARAWKNNKTDSELFLAATILFVVKILNDRDHGRI